MLDLDLGRSLPMLLDVALKSVLVSATALAALVGLRRASAATRHLVLLTGLGVLLGLPALMPLLPRQSLPPRVNPSRCLPRAEPLGFSLATPRLRGQKKGAASSPSMVLSSPAQTGAGTLEAPGFSPEKEGGLPAPASTPSIRPDWLVLGWLLGVLVCMGRMIAVHARFWRLTRRCPPLSLSLLAEAGPEAVGFAALLTGPAGTPPMVWGWPRPALLLPPNADDWPAARRWAVLLHESAHVRRHDWLTQTLTQAACALYWFNPLVWLLAARLGAEAERACDDAVLLSGVPPTDYAQDLLAVARSLGAGRAGQRTSLGAVTMARRSPVRGRLEAILDTRRPRRRATRQAAVLSVCMALAIAAPLATLRPAARADTPVATPPAPLAGVPTEADIVRARQHLHDLEQARATYATAHPNVLTASQIAEVDRLIEGLKDKRRQEAFNAFEAADNQRLRAEAKKPHTKQEREQIWGPIFAYEHISPIVVKRQHTINVWLAQLRSNVDALPAAQVARETQIHAFNRQIALDETQIEAMQMERAEGYSLHLSKDEIAMYARAGLQMEEQAGMSRVDWVHIMLLNSKLNQEKRLDDADVDSLVAILHTPSSRLSVAPSTAMCIFRYMRDKRMRPIPASQQKKIRDAVTPFLTHRGKQPLQDKWDRIGAEEVLELYGGSTPTPPETTP